MTNKQLLYSKLEDKMIKYADLINIAVKPTRQILIPIQPTVLLSVKQIDKNMRFYTGDLIYVRSEVEKKLTLASKSLFNIDPSLSLEIVYGYRALSIQQKLYNKYKRELKVNFAGLELLEATHRLIAVPEVSGHPTGGAVDIQIIKSGKPIPMGTKIWEFVQDSYTFSPFISKKAQVNRLLLRQIMMQVGFAPFDGEWWHFSFGDKEWAKYYDQPYAIYDQIEFKIKV